MPLCVAQSPHPVVLKLKSLLRSKKVVFFAVCLFFILHQARSGVVPSGMKQTRLKTQTLNIRIALNPHGEFGRSADSLRNYSAPVCFCGVVQMEATSTFLNTFDFEHSSYWDKENVSLYFFGTLIMCVSLLKVFKFANWRRRISYLGTRIHYEWTPA